MHKNNFKEFLFGTIVGAAIIVVLYNTLFVEYKYKTILADGGVYQGQWHNDLMHGDGKLVWPDGSVYRGEFNQGRMTGKGRLEETDGAVYIGDFNEGAMHGYGEYQDDELDYVGAFRHNRFHGAGEMEDAEGNIYTGNFENGYFHGQGKYVENDDDEYEGSFVKGEFTGVGEYRGNDGGIFKGSFEDWSPQGYAELIDEAGNQWLGAFSYGRLNGEGEYIGVDGEHYQGKFRSDRYHGAGSLTLPSGDQYEGRFRWGDYEGLGELSYAQPLDGVTKLRGEWNNGELINAARETPYNTRTLITETVLYNQHALLQAADEKLLPDQPSSIDMYFLGVAGYGSQAVFRREVLFVKEYFDEVLGTKGRSLALINDRRTIRQFPLATKTSIARSVRAIAKRMDTQNDILFVYLSSHGSSDFEFSLQQPGLSIGDLKADQLAEILAESSIKWKVVVVSSCYAGGHIDYLEDNFTLVIAAAAKDKTSFGCDNANQFTYFGEAFFKDALPQNESFSDAFDEAKKIVKAREEKQNYEFSNPKISKPKAILEHLRTWRDASLLK